MRARRLDDTPGVAADGAQGEALSCPLEKLLQHRGIGRRKEQTGPRKLPVTEQRAQQPRIDRKRLGVTVDAGRHVDPQTVPVSLDPQHLRHALAGERPGLTPITVMDAPEVLGARLRGTDRKSTRLNSSHDWF